MRARRAIWKIESVAMPMQDRQHMTYGDEDGVAASRIGQRDDAEADLRLGALKDPRAQSSRKELGTEADASTGTSCSTQARSRSRSAAR
jgi:hypothetical protein